MWTREENEDAISAVIGNGGDISIAAYVFRQAIIAFQSGLKTCTCVERLNFRSFAFALKSHLIDFANIPLFNCTALSRLGLAPQIIYVARPIQHQCGDEPSARSRLTNSSSPTQALRKSKFS